ncbi:hypothetical protein LCGC14_1596720 [marine sediment metagenome]|uniref:Uncharacterized protein n=1 Tax=marine sediment metagenome TaxID=412755 RepID=A0A0F9ICR6_9ZZZZ
MRFVHYSGESGLTKLDPAYHGTGIAGTEKRVAREYPDIFTPRLYAYHTQHTRDSKPGTFVYVGDVPDSLVLLAGSESAKALTVTGADLLRYGYAKMDVRARVEIETRRAFDCGYHAIDTGLGGIILLHPIEVTELPRDAMREIVELHNREGGCTYSLTLGNMAGKTGYAVSVHPFCNQQVAGKAIRYEHVVAFAAENRVLASDTILHIGTWYDTTTNATDIDVITTVGTVGWALELARKFDQKAIFDLSAMVTIPV